MSLSYSAKPADLRAPRKAMRLATRAAARQAGRTAREAIRKQVPNGAGPVGKWPGYAAKGRLQAAIVAQEPVQIGSRSRDGGSWEVRVGVQRTRKAAVYARIHEQGGTIRPVRAKVLRFVLHGQVIFAKRVRIRRKRWFLTGWRQAQEDIRATWKVAFRREMGIR